jgi:hypothetical protein
VLELPPPEYRPTAKPTTRPPTRQGQRPTGRHGLATT